MYLKFFFAFSDGPLPGQTSIPPMDMAEVVGDQVEDYGEEDDIDTRGAWHASTVSTLTPQTTKAGWWSSIPTM